MCWSVIFQLGWLGLIWVNFVLTHSDVKISYYLDLSQKPFKTLRYHKKAVRACQFHKKYPLFCSGSDDGTIIVSHGRVYNDLSTEPLIVPVKVLKGIKTSQSYGVMDVAFHPTLPWVFGSGVDGTIRLYS